jgi:hypothetical protein
LHPDGVKEFKDSWVPGFPACRQAGRGQVIQLFKYNDTSPQRFFKKETLEPKTP